MSWIEDNGDDYLIDNINNGSKIIDKINVIRNKLTEQSLDAFNWWLMDYISKNNEVINNKDIMLVRSIMYYYKFSRYMSDKQKYCIAKIIFQYDLQAIIFK